MNETIINHILQNHQLHQYEIRNHQNKLEIENENYIIAITVYHCQIAEETIYDKLKRDTFFYLHHDCSHNHYTEQFINDFLSIALDLTKNYD